ncbi:hypothetical protein WISP_28467 [Willisornis vidua]|uniref:Uncharacterized protein n=1 Tax=Willisornis vidua TaxID=1566151 RepID=A0ABQ9DRS7_9PASS|nr:hypothetical protein WISP_28467 [Willisornis vidua]
MHSNHSPQGEKGLPGPYPIAEDPSTCDIVKATQYGMLERCRELVEAGYDVRQPDKENVTLLHWAAINNRLELVKYYISKGAIVDQLGGDLNSTPLHWAIRPEPTRFLLKFNPSLNAVDNVHKNTALHWAVTSGNISAVDLLLEAGASLDIKNAKATRGAQEPQVSSHSISAKFSVLDVHDLAFLVPA